MDFQDWEPVIWKKKEPVGKELGSKKNINNARRDGTCIETTRKSKNTGPDNARKIEEETVIR